MGIVGVPLPARLQSSPSFAGSRRGDLETARRGLAFPERNASMTPSYCQLCREKEIELFGSVLCEAGERHRRAVKEAGCKHPAEYSDVSHLRAPLEDFSARLFADRFRKLVDEDKGEAAS
jgi:hypothetical protein